MDIITPSVRIKGTSNPAQAILIALCNWGTPEEPREPSSDEKWDAIKTVRNELLSASDWTQLIDNGLSVSLRTAWATYRQTLRDMPQDYATPEEIIWPEQPNG